MAKLSAAQKLVLNYYSAKLNLMHSINPSWAASSALKLFMTPGGKRRRADSSIFKKGKPIFINNSAGKIRGIHWLPQQTSIGKLLIAHGFGGSSRSFDRFVGPALGMGFEVIAFDAPAHGDSPGKHLNVNTYRWFLEDVIRQYGPFDLALAHSLGAMSLLLALATAQAGTSCKTAVIAPLTEGTRAVSSFFKVLKLPDALKVAFNKKVHELAGNEMSWYSMKRIAAQHTQPVLWIHDEDDDTTPFDDVKPIMELGLSHVKFFITKGLGHTAIYKDNKVKKAIIHFWKTGDLPTSSTDTEN